MRCRLCRCSGSVAKCAYVFQGIHYKPLNYSTLSTVPAQWKISSIEAKKISWDNFETKLLTTFRVWYKGMTFRCFDHPKEFVQVLWINHHAQINSVAKILKVRKADNSEKLKQYLEESLSLQSYKVHGTW